MWVVFYKVSWQNDTNIGYKKCRLGLTNSQCRSNQYVSKCDLRVIARELWMVAITLS